MKNYYIVILIFVLTGTSYADGVLLFQNGSFCLPDKEFKIAGITNGSTKNDVIALKGKPDSSKFENDINAEIIKYKDMVLEISNNHVLYMWTDSKSNGIPCGIYPGMSKDSIFRILGITPPKKELKDFQLVNCSKEVYLVLEFKNNVLLKLGMGNDAP